LLQRVARYPLAILTSASCSPPVEPLSFCERGSAEGIMLADGVYRVRNIQKVGNDTHTRFMHLPGNSGDTTQVFGREGIEFNTALNTTADFLQFWHVQRWNDQGYYRIRHVLWRTFLSLAETGYGPGVKGAPDVGVASRQGEQLWKLIRRRAGVYSLQNKATGSFLDFAIGKNIFKGWPEDTSDKPELREHQEFSFTATGPTGTSNLISQTFVLFALQRLAGIPTLDPLDSKYLPVSLSLLNDAYRKRNAADRNAYVHRALRPPGYTALDVAIEMRRAVVARHFEVNAQAATGSPLASPAFGVIGNLQGRGLNFYLDETFGTCFFDPFAAGGVSSGALSPAAFIKPDDLAKMPLAFM
jgi:hypothetical protein